MSVCFAEPIAIIGIGCRFPGGAKNPEDFWQFLCDQGNGIREIPDDRWSLETFYDADPAAISRATTKWGGFLEDVRCFDPEFFGISSREANSMDPQQRILMQVVYEALQDARLRIADIQAERTGVFVGVSTSDYGALQRLKRTNDDVFAGTGSALSIVANRISHRFDLSGPSYAVDTACSSSLVALDQACWSLNEGTCSRAIVGGVNILVDPGGFIAFSKAGMLSTTGTISTFDSAANGYVRGEGCGAVILKRLSDARRDQDRIYAVIRSTCINQDGHTSTLTAPNRDRQVAMLETLCERAEVDPASVDYVEAHGTGTPVGDPIEASAIGRVFGIVRDNEPVLVGSLKPNIGHLEPAAGVSGLIKTALAVHNHAIPPNRNFKNPNPNIPFELLGIKVPTELTEVGNGACLAAVNSFGFGGTNASALLASSDANEKQSARRSAGTNKSRNQHNTSVPVAISAATETSLRRYCADITAELAPGGALAGAALADVSANLFCRRDQFKHRAVVSADSTAHLRNLLTEIAEDRVPEPEPRKLPYTIVGRAGRSPKVAYTFAGQGGQWHAMARRLLLEEPEFRRTVQEFDEIFRQTSGWSVIAELKRSEARSKVHDPAVTQPAIFAVQIGLAALWKKAQVTPDVIIGHSFGEVAAAYVADGLSLEAATHLIHKRGLISRQIDEQGAMVALGLAPDQARELLEPDSTIDIAAFNGPTMVTLSGRTSEIDLLVARIESERPEVLVRRLAMAIAWHSRLLEPAEHWFKEAVGDIAWHTPKIPIISTVSGAPQTCFDADYWWANLRQPVAYETAVGNALDFGVDLFLEIGPHRTLSGLTATIASSRDKKVAIANSLLQDVDDFRAVGFAAATLFVSGVDVDFTALTGPPQTELELPIYPWDEIECWNDSEEARRMLKVARVHPLLGMRADGPQVAWENEMNLRAMGYLADHAVSGDVIFPAAGYIDMMLAAGLDYYGKAPIEIENLAILEALFITHDDDVLLRTTFDPDTDRVRIFSHLRDSSAGWVERASARLSQPAVEIPPAPQPPARADAPVGRMNQDSFYALTARHGYQYGNEFQGINDVVVWPLRVEANIVASSHGANNSKKHPTHPAVLDACIHAGIPMATIADDLPIFASEDGADEGLRYPLYLPIGADRLRFFSPLPHRLKLTVSRRKDKSGDTVADSFITDDAGNVCLTIDGFRMQKMSDKDSEKDHATAAPAFVLERFISVPPPSTSSDDTSEQADGQTASWLVIPDAGGVCNSIAIGLRGKGAAVQTLSLDDRDAADCDVLGQLISDWLAEIDGKSRILVGSPLDTIELEPDADADLMQSAVERNVFNLLALGKALDIIRESAPELSIWLLTRGARKVPAGPPLSATGLAQAPLTGMMRTVAAESRDFPHHHVDILASNKAEIANCIDLMHGDTDESEILLRGEDIYVPRLDAPETAALPRRPISVTPGQSEINFVATMQSPGSLDAIQLEETELLEIGDDEVRTAVEAVGLNFRDIMAATGLLPKEAEREPAWRNLGLEYAGTVVATGSKVSSLKPGDRVLGMGRRCLQGYLNQPAAVVSKIPDSVSSEDAATIPSAYATAHYALNHIARLSKGEKVLIHVATGGVGLAAIQLAKRAGAVIFATAGSDHKREFLRDLGVDHIMNSRSLDFADRIAELTGGDGVDVVLNSLPGDYIIKGLESLAPYGRFLEIGKRDVYMDSLVGMKALRKNITLSVIDLAAMGHERPELLRQLTEEVLEMVGAGEIEPLPTTVFPISEVKDAFRYMSQARHIGKVVVSFPQAPVAVLSSAEKPLELRADRSYLVTGGSRGFGLTIADWLSACGAGRIVLASRSGVPDADAEPVVAAIADRGTEVVNLALDITDSNAVAEFVKSMAADEKALAGIIHGAAVIKDGFLWQLDDDTVRSVLRPKTLGAWNLHRALTQAQLDLDFFISFSSLAQVLGSIGQANYVAANSFLDAFAHYRQDQGQAGQTIDWGALGESGFVARSDSMTNYLESMGLIAVDNADATRALETLLRVDVPSIAFAAVDWASVARASGDLSNAPRLQNMLTSDVGGGGRIKADIAASPRSEWVGLLSAFLVDQVSKVLNVDGSAVDAEKALTELGFDSLSSIELKNRVEGQLGLSIPVSAFLQTPTLSGLAETIAITLDEEQRKRAAASDKDTQTRDDRKRGASEHYDFQPTHDQEAVIAGSIGPFASDEGRRALEHRVQLRLNDAPTPSEVAAAFAKLVKRHSLLRLTAVSNATTGETKLALDTAPKVTCVDDAATALEPCLAVKDGELVRAVYSQASGRENLGLVVHAAVTDKCGFSILVEELLSLIDRQPLDRRTPEKALRAALRDRRFDEDSQASNAARAYWDAVLYPAVGPALLAARRRALSPLEFGASRGPASTLSFDMTWNGPEDEVETGLLTAFVTALFQVTDRPEIVVECLSPTRDADVPAGIVGPFDDRFPVVVRQGGQIGKLTPGAQIRRQLRAGRRHAALGTPYAETLLSTNHQAKAALRQFGFRLDNVKRTEQGRQQLRKMKLAGQTVKMASDEVPVIGPHELGFFFTRKNRSGLSVLVKFDTQIFAADLVRKIADTVANLCESGTQQPSHRTARGRLSRSRALGRVDRVKEPITKPRMPGAAPAE